LVQKLASPEGKRLLLVGGSEGAETVEIAHEALVTQWPRYQTWLQAAAADKRVLDRLIERAVDFPLEAHSAAERKAWQDRLATGADLAAFQGLAGRHSGWLSAGKAAFVEACTAAATVRRRREVGLLWGALLAAAVAVVAAVVALHQRNLAIQQTLEAERQTALADQRAADAQASLIWNRLEPGFPRWLGFRLTSCLAFGRKVRSLRGEK
jgi:hypothetical protein